MLNMKKQLKSLFLGFAFIFAVASPLMALASPAQPVQAACDNRFLGIPAWYRGLTDDKCDVKAPESEEDGLAVFIWKIVLNIIEAAMFLVSYIALFFIMYGGFMYLTGGSVPGQLEKAKKSILNAVIGLTIALSAIALTNLIMGVMG